MAENQPSEPGYLDARDRPRDRPQGEPEGVTAEAGAADPKWPWLLEASWQRSMLFGVEAQGTASDGGLASSTQLARLLQTRQQLLTHACPSLHQLSKTFQGFDGILMLADPSGIVLCSLGNDAFAESAARVALRAGANWHERWRGTNAIGTVIATGQPVAVNGVEHYLARNAFLSCVAAPIRDPGGHLAGVLNASAPQGHLPANALDQVRLAAKQIEHRLFKAHFSTEVLVLLHPMREELGTTREGLLALSEEGIVVGANDVAKALLGLVTDDFGQATAASVMGRPLFEIVPGFPGLTVPLNPTRSPNEFTLHGQIEPRAARPPRLASQDDLMADPIRHRAARARR